MDHDDPPLCGHADCAEDPILAIACAAALLAQTLDEYAAEQARPFAGVKVWGAPERRRVQALLLMADMMGPAND